MSATALPPLTALPPAAALFAKAALTATRKAAKDAVIPSHSVRLESLSFSPEHVEAYNRICGLPAGTLALTYPQVVVAGLHIYVLLQKDYPYPLLGMVHLRNHIQQHQPLSIGNNYQVEVAIGDASKSPLGIEVPLHTRYFLNGECVWQATTTVLHRQKTRVPRAAMPPPPPAVTAQYVPFSAPEDIGRRYAPIAGDYNPIHQYALTAKAFGFDRAIAHGMWSLARCLGILLPSLPGTATELSVQFKQPLLLPSDVTLKHYPSHNGLNGLNGLAFDLLAREGGKTHFSGHIGCA